MHEFRLMIDSPLDAADNMAKDRAILEGMSTTGALPVLRLYRWMRPSVTIGYFQDIEETVNEEFCRANGISVTRRLTAGGTVLHHMELTYSFTIRLRNGVVPEPVDEAFRAILQPLISTLKSMAIKAVYRPVNDIVVNNRKISGSAQVRKKGILQQHGTLLLGLDRGLLSGALKADHDKYAMRGFSDPADAVTSVASELKTESDDGLIRDITDGIVENFSRLMNINFTADDLTGAEQLVMKIYTEAMASDEWNYQRKSPVNIPDPLEEI